MQCASRQHHAQRVALADHGAWLQGGDFPQVSHNRGPNAGLVDAVGQAGECRLCRADVAIKLGALTDKLGDASRAVAVFGALVAFQPAARQMQGVGCRPLLVRVGLAAQVFCFAGGGGAHAGSLALLLACPGGRLV